MILVTTIMAAPDCTNNHWYRGFLLRGRSLILCFDDEFLVGPARSGTIKRHQKENTAHLTNSPIVFFANGLGDTLLALPALRALAATFVKPVTMVCDVGVAQLLASSLPTWRFVELPMRRNAPDWTREFDVDEVVEQIPQGGVFVSLAPWFSESLQQLLVRLEPEASLGYFADYSVELPLRFDKHAADLMFDIPLALDDSLRIQSFSDPLVLDDNDTNAARSLMSKLPHDCRVLIVHTDTGRNKMWPENRFVQVLDAFLDRHLDYVALVVGVKPQVIDTGRHGERVIPCHGLPLETSLALVNLADVFIGIDSCMLHAADLFRIPGVGLFGASSAEEYGFRFTRKSRIVSAPSMLDISVAAVLDGLNVVADNAAENLDVANAS